jgi:branched-chain amino acid aminotransferase
MNYYDDKTVVFRDGKFIRANEVHVDLYSQSLHYGYAVFEGIRAYRTVGGDTRIFKAREHFDRLHRSAAAMNIPLVYETEQLIEASYELLSRNSLSDAYIRPLVYVPANMSFSRSQESHLAIAVWEMEPFLGEKLLRVMTSSFQRPNPGAFKMEAKAAGHYVNSILASQEAKAAGFDEALLTDMHGFVAEGPGANVFFEQDGQIITPGCGHILPGITRATVMEICHDLGIGLMERSITVDEARQADSAFFCGTATEVIGWDSLDDHRYPKSWPLSLGQKIQEEYKCRVTENYTASVPSRGKNFAESQGIENQVLAQQENV